MNQDQNINPEEALRAVFGEPHQIADGITAFGPVVYAYTRAQAVADGVQVEVTKTAQEAGIKFPMFLTRQVSLRLRRQAAGGAAERAHAPIASQPSPSGLPSKTQIRGLALSRLRPGNDSGRPGQRHWLRGWLA